MLMVLWPVGEIVMLKMDNLMILMIDINVFVKHIYYKNLMMTMKKEFVVILCVISFLVLYSTDLMKSVFVMKIITTMGIH
jgi:hypothetical protein